MSLTVETYLHNIRFCICRLLQKRLSYEGRKPMLFPNQSVVCTTFTAFKCESNKAKRLYIYRLPIMLDSPTNDGKR